MTRLVSRLCSGVRLLANGMLTNSVWHQAMVGNLPLINGNDYLWSVICRIIVFVAALVSNQWENTISHSTNLFSHFPLHEFGRFCKSFFGVKLWASGSGHLCGGGGQHARVD
jgi:hypothetical protein